MQKPRAKDFCSRVLQSELSHAEKKVQAISPSFATNKRSSTRLPRWQKTSARKIQQGLGIVHAAETSKGSEALKEQAALEREKLKNLERFVRMPVADYVAACARLDECTSRAHAAKTHMVEAI